MNIDFSAVYTCTRFKFMRFVNQIYKVKIYNIKQTFEKSFFS